MSFSSTILTSDFSLPQKPKFAQKHAGSFAHALDTQPFPAKMQKIKRMIQEQEKDQGQLDSLIDQGLHSLRTDTKEAFAQSAKTLLVALTQLSKPLNLSIFDDAFYDEIIESSWQQLPDKPTARKAREIICGVIDTYCCTNHAYGKLSGRLSLIDIYEDCPASFVESMLNNMTPLSQSSAVNLTERDEISVDAEDFMLSNAKRIEYQNSNVRENMRAFINKHRKEIDSILNHDRDLNFHSFAIVCMKHGYLKVRMSDKDIMYRSRPQHIFLAVALELYATPGHFDEDAVDPWAKVRQCYDELTLGLYIHATPTLFNSLADKPQLASCYLTCICGDSIDGIYKSIWRLACYCQRAGGVSVHLGIRETNAPITGTSMGSKGVVPPARVLDSMLYHVQQNKHRKGAGAAYMKIIHPDFLKFLHLRKVDYKYGTRVKELFLAAWVPDLFFERLSENGVWSFFSYKDHQILWDTWGDEFEQHYKRLEKEGKYVGQMPAKDVFAAMVAMVWESGQPYICSGDACNRKSNHQHRGTIHCSNLCTEIMQYCSGDETAVCVLASLILSKPFESEFLPPIILKPEVTEDLDEVLPENHLYWDWLYTMVYNMVENLDNVIDQSHYPEISDPQGMFEIRGDFNAARRGARLNRALGFGGQAYDDLLRYLHIPYCSDAAKLLSRRVMETIYYAALTSSCRLAKERGVYETYVGSPMEKQGLLQHDMWLREYEEFQVKAETNAYYADRVKYYNQHPLFDPRPVMKRWDWDILRANIREHGVRNSLLVAPMPTQATSRFHTSTPAFEPGFNIFVFRTISGEAFSLNRWLTKDLESVGLATPEIINAIKEEGGFLDAIEEIPDWIKEIHKNVFDVDPFEIVDQARVRAPFVDQSYSLNHFMPKPDANLYTDLIRYSHMIGLKTNSYYVHTIASAKPLHINNEEVKEGDEEEEETEALMQKPTDNKRKPTEDSNNAKQTKTQ